VPPCFLDEVVRDGCSDDERRIARRMGQSELGGMEHWPLLAPFAIEPVADEGVSDGGEVNSDLMCPPRLQHDREQRRAGGGIENVHYGIQADVSLSKDV